MAFTPKCKYCRRPVIRRTYDGPPFRKTLTLVICEYCDKLQRRNFR